MKSTGLQSTKNKSNNSNATNAKNADWLMVTAGILIALFADWILSQL